MMMTPTTNVTSRNLTDVFILMRNNSLQNKHIFSDQILDDKVALVSRRDSESSGFNHSRSIDLPPVWIEGIENVQYEMSRIRNKLQELTALYDKHLTRPSIDDAVQEEKAIEITTQEITRMFHHCKKIIHQIRERSRGTTSRDHQVSQNVVSSLVTSLQELSTMFHSSQSTHLRKLRSREEKSQQFFDSPYLPQNDDLYSLDMMQEDYVNQSFLNSSGDHQMIIEDNTFMVEQREREIKQIVQSIAELNEIFRDLSTMVADQGTVLDRIDYNLEQVQSHVHQGLKQLQKAQNYQRKNRKMMCIMILSTTVVFLIILLVILKA